jgi:hypothetical protein
VAIKSNQTMITVTHKAGTKIKQVKKGQITSLLKKYDAQIQFYFQTKVKI